MKRLMIIVGAILCLGSGLPCHAAQQPIVGDWIGQIDLAGSWQRINFHFKIEGQSITGTLDLPRQNRTGLSLNRVTLDSSHVRIEWQGSQGLGVFDGQFRDGAISGDFQQGEIKHPFRVVRTSMFDPKESQRYSGSYRLAKDRFIDIGAFSENEDRPVFFDSQTRRTGVLYALSDTEFFSGPSYGNLFPMEVRATFTKNARGEVTGLKWQESDSHVFTAKKVSPYTQEEVSFQNGDVTLHGTLTAPATKGQHPALVVVPGSGSFRRPGGHWIHFFVRQGIAVLVFDKRGSGDSTGDWKKSTYEDLAADTLAGVQALKNHKNINPKQIGLLGHSEGGWVVPLAASLSTDIAFLIIRSGSALPTWKTVLHESEGKLRDGNKLSEAEIRAALALKQSVERMALAGTPWDEAWSQINAAYEKAHNEKWFGYVGGIPKDHWYWQWWRLRGGYDPAPALEKVRCPVLVLLGGVDWNIPSKESAVAFESAFKKAGNKDFTVRILPEGNHGLLEAETGYDSEFPRLNRYVPGYMDGIADWLLKRVNIKS